MSDSDDDFFPDENDDPILQKIMEKMRNEEIKKFQEKKPAVQGVLPKKPDRGIIPSNLYPSILQTFGKLEKGNCKADVIVKDYVQRGCEINSALREKREGKYKNLIDCLDKVKTPLQDLLPRDFTDNFVVVYRQMYTPYDESSNKGYISTSNIPLLGFGKYSMKIFLPKTTRVLLADISKEVGRNAYEIILPRDTILTKVAINKNKQEYFIPNINEIPKDIFNEILSYIESEIDNK